MARKSQPKKFLNTKKLIELIINAASEKKALEIKVVDIAQKSSIASHFIFCTGESVPQIKAIADHICDQLASKRHQKIRLEGQAKSGWVILDAGAILVHILLPSERDFYKLEDLWGENGIIYHE